MIDHCIAAFQKNQEDKIFRDYLTESVRLGVQGKYLSLKYDEILHPKPVETKTAKDVINHMKKKLAALGGK